MADKRRLRHFIFIFNGLLVLVAQTCETNKKTHTHTLVFRVPFELAAPVHSVGPEPAGQPYRLRLARLSRDDRLPTERRKRARKKG